MKNCKKILLIIIIQFALFSYNTLVTLAAQSSYGGNKDPDQNINININDADINTGSDSSDNEDEKELRNLFGNELISTNNEIYHTDLIKDKIIGIYFSAHWCPPCRVFTPKLVDFYNKLHRNEKSFQVIFVSLDKDKESMTNYMQDMNMPWLAIEYNNPKREALIEQFKIRSVPILIIISDKGKIISDNARSEIMDYGTKAYDKWTEGDLKLKNQDVGFYY